MPEIVKDLPLTPALSATSDDPHMAEKIAAEEAKNAPPLSVASDPDKAVVGEIAAAGDLTAAQLAEKSEADKAAETQKTGDDVTATDKAGGKEDKTDQTPPWMKAFISKTKNAEAEARREAAEAKKQLAEALKVMQTFAPPPRVEPTRKEPQAPNRNQFNDPEAYESAVVKYADERADWVAEQRVQSAMTELTHRQERKAAEDAATKAEQERQAFLEKGRTKYDDFSELCETDALPITPVMFEAAKTSDVGEEIVYHLGQHPAEARRIAGLTPVAQVREIARLEAKLTAPPPAKPPTKAPPPIKPVGGNNVVSKSAEDESVDEYIARRRSEMKGKAP